jgi:hypothetical protein
MATVWRGLLGKVMRAEQDGILRVRHIPCSERRVRFPGVRSATTALLLS